DPAQLHPVDLVGAVVHEHPQIHADLVGRQAHAVGGFHGLEHVLDQGAELVVERLDGAARVVQHRVADDTDGAYGHGAYLTTRVRDGARAARASPGERPGPPEWVAAVTVGTRRVRRFGDSSVRHGSIPGE